MNELSDEALERYARHIFLREIGGPGQKRLLSARAAVVGAGGLGSPAILYLAAAGLGRITVIDDDTVSLSNLQRQILHRTADIGRPKVESAAEHVAALNPGVTVHPLAERLEEGNAEALLAGHDLVLDGCDSLETRRIVNRAAFELGIPVVSGAISQWEGQVTVFDPASGTPCYACVFPEDPAAGLAPSCAEAGVMGALPGVVGAMMALEAIKLVTEAGHVLRGEMLVFDGLWGESRKLRLKPRPGCPVCGGAPAAEAG